MCSNLSPKPVSPSMIDMDLGWLCECEYLRISQHATANSFMRGVGVSDFSKMGSSYGALSYGALNSK